MEALLPQRSYVLERTNPLAASDFPDVAVFDQLHFNGQNGEIKILRETIRHFYQHPSGKLRLLAISNGHELSPLLQNTLLKTLEEPPSSGTVVVQANSADTLLPTLRSRLQPLKGVSRKRESLAVSLPPLESLYTLDRQDVIDQLGRVQAALNLTEAADLRRHRVLERSIRRLRQNVNLKLALDWLGLNWEKEFSKE